MEGKLQIMRCIKRTHHHRFNGHLVQFLQAFDQGARYQQGLYLLESQPSICQQRVSCGVLPGQLTLASAFTGGTKCYKHTHPKQVKISFPIVNHLVVVCGMPHYIVQLSAFWQFRKDVESIMRDPIYGKWIAIVAIPTWRHKREILKHFFFYCSVTLDLWTDRAIWSFILYTS